MLSDLQVSKLQAKKFEGFRTRLYDEKVELSNVLGQVTRKIFSEMVNAIVRGQIEHLNHVQSNGDWQLLAYEHAVDVDANDNECILLVCKYVDASNSEDLQYRNGVESATQVNVNVQGNSALDARLIAILEKLSDAKAKD